MCIRDRVYRIPKFGPLYIGSVYRKFWTKWLWTKLLRTNLLGPTIMMYDVCRVQRGDGVWHHVQSCSHLPTLPCKPLTSSHIAVPTLLASGHWWLDCHVNNNNVPDQLQIHHVCDKPILVGCYLHYSKLGEATYSDTTFFTRAFYTCHWLVTVLVGSQQNAVS